MEIFGTFCLPEYRRNNYGIQNIPSFIYIHNIIYGSVYDQRVGVLKNLIPVFWPRDSRFCSTWNTTKGAVEMIKEKPLHIKRRGWSMFHVKPVMCGLRFANLAFLGIPFQYFSLEPGLVGHIHSQHSGVSKFSRAVQLCFTANGVKVILVM